MTSKCQIFASNMTCASKMATSTVSAAKGSTNTSTHIFCKGAMTSTNTPAGSAMGSQVPSSTRESTPSPMQLKRSSEVDASAVSTTKGDSTLLQSVGDYFSPPPFEENDTHRMILESMRLGAKWEEDLEGVHGFTEAEACECFSRAGKYLSSDEFPEDAVNEKLLSHAKEGWGLLKEVDRLCKAYPGELMDLDRAKLF